MTCQKKKGPGLGLLLELECQGADLRQQRAQLHGLAGCHGFRRVSWVCLVNLEARIYYAPLWVPSGARPGLSCAPLVLPWATTLAHPLCSSSAPLGQTWALMCSASAPLGYYYGSPTVII